MLIKRRVDRLNKETRDKDMEKETENNRTKNIK